MLLKPPETPSKIAQAEISNVVQGALSAVTTPEEFHILGKLGKGSFGSIYLAEY
jgi:hypothetical protein